MNAPVSFGHNEITVRLGLLAEDARAALARVDSGETTAIDGWLAYGAALNEGRTLFPSNELFGEWVVSSNLRLSDNDKMERAAAKRPTSPSRSGSAPRSLANTCPGIAAPDTSK